MNIVDEYFGANNSSNNYSDNIIKEEWKDKQKQDRQDIYNIMDKMALEIRNNDEKFKKYLEIQTRFLKYSVGNCLVLLDKAPNSTHIRDKKSWEEKGYSLNANSQEIKILEPKVVNDKRYYNPKTVYDISQTNAEITEEKIKYDDRCIIEVLLYNVDADQQPVDKLPNGKIGVEYDREKNILYVCRGLDRNTFFRAIAQEIASYDFRNEKYIENDDLRTFYSYCVSYMICKNYDFDVSDYNFKNLPPEINEQTEGKNVREKLEKIRRNYEKVNSRMMRYFENGGKEKHKSALER